MKTIVMLEKVRSITVEANGEVRVSYDSPGVFQTFRGGDEFWFAGESPDPDKVLAKVREWCGQAESVREVASDAGPS